MHYKLFHFDEGTHRARLFINLRLLQPAAKVGINHLPLGEDIEACNTRLTVSVSGTASAPEGELYLGTGGTGVDVENTRRDVAHGTLDATDILCVDGAGKAVLRVVVHSNGLIERAYADHRERRAEDLLLCNTHGWLHVLEERGPVEMAVCKLTLAGYCPASNKGRALGFANFGVCMNFRELFLVDDRSDIGLLV